MNQIVLQWTGSGVAFDTELPGQHVLKVDEPPPTGADLGASPTDLFLVSLAACSGISTIALAKKMRQPVVSLEIRASGERQDEWPKAFTRIHLLFHFTLETRGDRSQIDKAVNLAVTRYCPVSATLQLGEGGCEVTHETLIDIV